MAKDDPYPRLSGATPASKADIVERIGAKLRHTTGVRLMLRNDGADALSDETEALLREAAAEIERLKAQNPSGSPKLTESVNTTERLRDAANRRGYYDSAGRWVNDGQLLDEAADEIERLRKAIALLPPTLTVDGRASVNVPQLLVAYAAIEAALKAPAPTKDEVPATSSQPCSRSCHRHGGGWCQGAYQPCRSCLGVARSEEGERE